MIRATNRGYRILMKKISSRVNRKKRGYTTMSDEIKRLMHAQKYAWISLANDSSRNCKLQEESPPCQLAKLHRYLIGIEGFYVNVSAANRLSLEMPFLFNNFNFPLFRAKNPPSSPIFPLPSLSPDIYCPDYRKSLRTSYTTNLAKHQFFRFGSVEDTFQPEGRIN